VSSASTSGLAIAAFVISVFSVVWNAARSLLDFPRVSAIISKHVRVHVGESVNHRFRVTAINTGHADTVIADVGLQAVPGGYDFRVEYYRDEGFTISGPDLPATLPGHGSLSWDFPDELTQNVPQRLPLRGLVIRYRPVGMRARLHLPINPLKVYYTPYSEQKG
jgi:hypothetical protein